MKIDPTDPSFDFTGLTGDSVVWRVLFVNNSYLPSPIEAFTLESELRPFVEELRAPARCSFQRMSLRSWAKSLVGTTAHIEFRHRLQEHLRQDERRKSKPVSEFEDWRLELHGLSDGQFQLYEDYFEGNRVVLPADEMIALFQRAIDWIQNERPHC